MSPPRRVPNMAPIIVRGAPFTFRTLHPLDLVGIKATDRRIHRAREYLLPLTFDQEQTFTLPAISGLRHCEPACLEVRL